MKKNVIPLLLFILFGVVFFINGPLPLLFYLKHYDTAALSQYGYIVIILSYICIIVTLLLEKNNLAVFNFDRSSLIILVMVGIVRINLHVPNETLYKTLILALSVVLLAIVISTWTKIPKSNFRWATIGILVCIVVIPLAFVESAQMAKYLYSNKLYQEEFFTYAVRNFLFNFSFVAPFEEITIRGILWGLLRQWEFSEKTIIWVQGILFWLIHYGQILTPITFFITLPIAIITYSLLTFYSKQTFPSIIAHALLNTMIPIFVMFYA